MRCNSCGSWNVKTEKHSDGKWDFHTCLNCKYYWWNNPEESKS